MTRNDQELRPGEEEALEALLREMPPVTGPAPEVRERIRQAVAAEWRAAAAQAAAARAPERSPARRSWQRPAMAMAASVAVVAVALGVIQTRSPDRPLTVAKLTRQSGAVETGSAGSWRPAAAGQALTPGQELATGPAGKAALTLRHGITVRLDTDTRVAFRGIDRILVERGAVYLDAGLEPSRDVSVRIDSAFGSTRHLGTQYEVRVAGDGMRVSVREGRVELTAADARPVTALAGEQLSIDPAGSIERGTVDKRDPRWNWISDVTPPFAIEDRRLSEFLAWVCRETGRELHFASPQAEAAAEAVVLRGSVAGLSPDDALAAVMATTNLSYSDENGRLTVRSPLRQAAAR